MKIAACNWELDPDGSLDGLLVRLSRRVERAFEAGADLVVFPELVPLEILGSVREGTMAEQARRVADAGDAYRAHAVQLAAETGIVVCAGSYLVLEGSEVAHYGLIAWPDGRTLQQPKNKLTVFERDEWRFANRSGLAHPIEGVGLAVCYDSEFPECVRTLAEAGMTVLCVPAFTEGVQGFSRVRNCCLARAVENQVYVVHASLRGGLDREPVPQTWGGAAVLAPPIDPFPEDGILAADWEPDGMAIAEVDIETLLEARQRGDVRNWNDRSPGCWRF